LAINKYTRKAAGIDNARHKRKDALAIAESIRMKRALRGIIDLMVGIEEIILLNKLGSNWSSTAAYDTACVYVNSSF
jgi:hypothetical protein